MFGFLDELFGRGSDSAHAGRARLTLNGMDTRINPYAATGDDTVTVRGTGIVVDGGDGNDVVTADTGSTATTL